MANVYIAHGSPIGFLMDFVLWLLLPIVGGMIGIATFISFESDKQTFHHMGLDQSKLYQGLMLFLKMIIFGSRPSTNKDTP